MTPFRLRAGATEPGPAMSMVAALSGRLRIAPFVVNDDLRHPAVLAHDLVTLDLLSGGAPLVERLAGR